jgi:hypothetical protein
MAVSLVSTADLPVGRRKLALRKRESQMLAWQEGRRECLVSTHLKIDMLTDWFDISLETHSGPVAKG